jgi:hypothetical protein
MIIKDMKDGRKIFKDMGMSKWREAEMSDLKKGTRVRVYSQAGRPLELGGDETFITTSDAYQKDGVWCVEVKSLT